jgi:hypothetical protein
MNTVNEQDGRMTPGDVPATRDSYFDYEGRTAREMAGVYHVYSGTRGMGMNPVTHAEAVEWVSNCPLYLERLGKTKPVTTPPTRFADADLSTWCQRYEGEDDKGVVCGPGGHWCNGRMEMVPVGCTPGRGEDCRSATEWAGGWWCNNASGGMVDPKVTREAAVRWVRDGVLP